MYTITVPSNRITIGALEHKEHDIIVIGARVINLRFTGSPYGLYFTGPSIRCVFVFHATCYFCDDRISNKV